MLPIDDEVDSEGELRSPGGHQRFTGRQLQALGLLAPADDPFREFSAQEQEVAEWLADRGVDVVSVTEANDLGRTPDAALVDTLETIEFKVPTLATVPNVRRAATSARGQSGRVLIDGRSVDLDAATAREAIVRALGLVGLDLLELVVILGDGTSVGWARG